MFRPATKDIPQSPGVYWYLKGRQVIYVGKAKNLKNRLGSYRRLSSLDEKTKLMLQTAGRVKFKQLASEVEAVITEARLIKLYQPRFNLILRDDRSPVYLTITREKYPRILINRQGGNFGPFSSSRTLKSILARLRRIFPYCEKPNGQRACFYFHLGLCPGACTGKISPQNYKKNIRHISWFFLNKKRRLLSNLKKDMLAAAKDQNYAKAAQIKTQFDCLTYFWQAQFLPLELPKLSGDQVNIELKNLFKIPISRIEMYDISNLSGTNPTGGMVVATNGRIDKKEYRLFNIRGLNSPNDPAMMAQMLQRRLNHPEWTLPELIVVDGGLTQIKAVKKISPPNILVVGLAKNPDRLVFYDGVKHIRPLLTASAAARLLIQLRDEAHRFGRRQHLRLRSKSLWL